MNRTDLQVLRHRIEDAVGTLEGIANDLKLREAAMKLPAVPSIPSTYKAELDKAWRAAQPLGIFNVKRRTDCCNKTVFMRCHDCPLRGDKTDGYVRTPWGLFDPKSGTYPAT